MGCGQKAYYEKLEEQAREEQKAALKSKPPYILLNTIESVLDNLKRMSNTPELSLTKTNWIRLDGCIKSLSDLLK